MSDSENEAKPPFGTLDRPDPDRVTGPSNDGTELTVRNLLDLRRDEAQHRRFFWLYEDLQN